MARAYIGISCFDYARWRSSFYRPDVPRRSWLGFASRIDNSVELNGSFYSLKSPATLSWLGASRRGRDVSVYFDNDAKVHALPNAMQLADLLSVNRANR